MGALSRNQARHELWRRGNLSWQLRDYQREMVAAVDRSAKRVFFSLCSRRMGKTRTALTRAHEKARKGRVVRFCYPTLLQAEDVLVPMSDEILSTCPDEFKPKFSAKHLAWEYPDGMVKLAGAENRRAANRLRGATTDDFMLDEAGFYDEFEYILKDVVMPTLLTSDGMAWLLSTPSDTPGHPSRETYLKCAADGATAHYDINVIKPYYGQERIDEFIAEAGGLDSTTCQREYFCKWVTDAARAVVPEFTANKTALVGEVPRPDHYHPIVAADFGFNDMTVVAFGYYDFARAVVVIEDEIACQRQSSLEVGRRVHAKERELGYEEPQRVADAPLQILADMYEATGVTFGPARKDDADAALNHLRRCCQERKILIHPRCTTIIAHLEAAIWNRSRTNYERSEAHGHYDGVDAVKYLLRHVDMHSNPFPALAPGVTSATHWIPQGLLEGTQRQRELTEVFKWR